MNRILSSRMTWALVTAVLLAALALAGGVAGAILTVKDIFPVPSIARTLVRMYEGPPRETGKRIESILLGLEVESAFDVPPAKRPQGGGLTSLGRELIVINNDGLLYVVGASGLQRASLRAPDNGYERYVNASKRFAPEGYRFHLGRLRYNDVLVVQDGDVRMLLVSYIEWVDDKACYRNTISGTPIGPKVESILDLDASAPWTVVYQTKPCLPIKKMSAALEGHMAGGKMANLGNGRIGYTSGDFHWDGATGPIHPDPQSKIAVAQDPTYEYGKVLSIDWRTGSSEIVSSGNRNMQGIAATPDGKLWTVEHGPRGGDELNLQERGRNFGWPVRTYGTQYNLLPHPGAAPYGRHDGFDPPAFAWVPSVAVSGLTVVSGFDPAWDGDLLAGSLKSASLFRIRVQDGRPVYAEPILIGHRLRAVHQHVDGRIAIWTDNDKILLLKTRSGSLAIQAARDAVGKLDLGQKLADATDAAIVSCAECHSFEYDQHTSAPSLGGLMGRRIGATAFERRSEALARRGGRWSPETLDAFLAGPETFAPGTTMPDPRLDPKVRKALVEAFRMLAKDGN